MRVITSEAGDLLSHFDKFDESQAQINNTSLHHHLIDKHDVCVSERKIKGHLPLELIFGFCRTFEKITKHLGFHLTFKTADLQDTVYTSLGDDNKVNFDEFFYTIQYSLPMLKHR